MKKIFAGVALLLVVAAAALWYAVCSLDAIVEAAIERYGSEATGVLVTVESVRLSLRSGQGSIRGLVIGSPEGFRAPSTFELDSIRVALDTATLVEDPVVVKEIRIEAPRATYEWGRRGSNVAVIQNNVNAFAARYARGSGRAAGEPAEQRGRGRKLVIENLIVRGGSLDASTTLVEGEQAELELPDLHVKDIGKKQGGASAVEVTAQILEALTADATRGMAGSNRDALRGWAEQEASEALDEALDAGAESAADALKDLFGP